MHAPITDLAFIAAQAAGKETEHEQFRSFIEQQNPAAIDTLVQALYHKVSPQIDCTQCGNCCRAMMITLETTDTTRIAAHLGINDTAFASQYLDAGIHNTSILNQMPCPFLSGNTCSVYEHRFSICREFPHLHKPGFTLRLYATLQHYSICPIIYNVVEQLKINTGFEGDKV
jgi:uncharacterized protein